MASLVCALVGGSAAQAVTGSVAAMLRGRLLHGPLRLADTAGGLRRRRRARTRRGLAGRGRRARPAHARPPPRRAGLDRAAGAAARYPGRRGAARSGAIRPAPGAPVDRRPGAPAARSERACAASAARRDSRSVVRIEGTACGLDIQGSGWVLRPGIVVTNAHVVAGEQDAQVEAPGGVSLTGIPIAVDPGNDVALLRVAGPAPAPAATLAEGSVRRRRDPDRLPRGRPPDGRGRACRHRR